MYISSFVQITLSDIDGALDSSMVICIVLRGREIHVFPPPFPYDIECVARIRKIDQRTVSLKMINQLIKRIFDSVYFDPHVRYLQ